MHRQLQRLSRSLQNSQALDDHVDCQMFCLEFQFSFSLMRSTIALFGLFALNSVAIKPEADDDSPPIDSRKVSKEEWKQVGKAAKDAGQVLKELFNRPEVRKAASEVGKKAMKYGKVYGKKAYVTYKNKQKQQVESPKKKPQSEGNEDDPYDE